jgi:hypothetical protein
VTLNPVTALLAVLSTTPVYNAANSATVTVSSSISAPTGTVQFSVDGTASGSPTAISAGAATYALPILAAGAHTIAATYSGDSIFAATPVTGISVTVSQAASVVTWAAPASIVYGTALGATQLNATASVPGAIVYSPAIGAVLGAGTQTLSAAFTPTDATDYTTATKTNSLVVAKQGTTTAITLSATSINPGQSLTITAGVTEGSGTPTGTVTFLDGTTTLGTSNVSGTGIATFSTTALLSGTHAITANYSGDSNYLVSSATTSATAITVAPLDFTLTGSDTLSNLNVKAGTPAVLVFQVSPTFGSYPSAVTFSVSEVPSAGTATFSPTSIPANGGTVNVTLTIQTAGLSARNAIEQHFAPIALAVLLLPFSLARRFRKSRPGFNRLFTIALIVLLGAAATTGLTGCGATNNNQIKDYTVSITATSGTVQHTATALLSVE